MENPTHSFREMSLLLQLIEESQIKSNEMNNCDELELMKERGGHPLYRSFCPNNFF